MRRVASIWLPQLAIERWAKASDYPPDAPVVLTVEGPHGLLIHAVTKEAATRGARPGVRLTDARALDPSLVAIPADPDGDAALVMRLATWAGRWSPLVEVDGDGLRLDVSGQQQIGKSYHRPGHALLLRSHRQATALRASSGAIPPKAPNS